MLNYISGSPHCENSEDVVADSNKFFYFIF